MYSNSITEAVSRFVSKQPFFATYMYDMMQLVEDDSISTAATDGVTIIINPKFFDGLSIQEREFVLAHEVLHGIYMHMSRGKLYSERGFGPDLLPWNHQRFNAAADYIINDVLADSKIGTMPQGCLHNPRWDKDWLADDVYQELKDEDFPPEGGRPGFDDHLEPKDPPSEEEVKTAVNGAKNAAKAMGKMPAGLERLVGKMLDPVITWRDHLRAMLTANAGRDQATWARPNRRRIATPPHIYFPGSTGFAMGVVAIVIDTSGSVSERELQQFLAEVASILDECTPEMIYVLWTDAQVAGVDEVTDANELQYLKPKGGGGTHMPAAFEYMDEHDIHPETCVVLTDGYTSFGNEQEYDVIWGITSNQITAPHGKSIYVEIK